MGSLYRRRHSCSDCPRKGRREAVRQFGLHGLPHRRLCRWHDVRKAGDFCAVAQSGRSRAARNSSHPRRRHGVQGAEPAECSSNPALFSRRFGSHARHRRSDDGAPPIGCRTLRGGSTIHCCLARIVDRGYPARLHRTADSPPSRPAMRYWTGMRNWPLRSQLMLLFALLSIATTGITTVTLLTLASQRMNADLRDKSSQYARQLQRELESVVAFDDRLTARELFDSMMADRSVDGLAVYDSTGELLEGRGNHPAQLASLTADMGKNTGHAITVAKIQSREG